MSLPDDTRHESDELIAAARACVPSETIIQALIERILWLENERYEISYQSWELGMGEDL